MSDKFPWNDDLDVLIDGVPYPVHTVHSMNGGAFPVGALMDLDDTPYWESIVAHELGHALLHMRAGTHVVGVVIHADTPLVDSSTESRYRAQVWTLDNQSGDFDALVPSAAGERAQDRYLRQEGLWTPVRSLAVEFEAVTDRAAALKRNPDYGFGDRPKDYGDLLEEADRILDELWPTLMKCLPAVLASQTMTGYDLADLSRIPNPACPT